MDSHVANLFQSNNFRDLIDQYDKKKDQLSPVSCYFLSIAYLFESSFEKALEILLNLVKTSKELPDIHCYLALTYLRLGDYQKAKREINKVSPPHSTLYYEINIEIAIKCGQVKRAMRLINASKKENAYSVTIAINESVILVFKRKTTEAKALLIPLIEKDPFNQIIYDNLIRIFTSTKESSKSEAVMKQYLAKFPEHFPYLWHLIGLYAGQGRNDEIKNLIKQMKKNGVKDVGLREVMGMSSFFQSDKEIEKFREFAESQLDLAIHKQVEIKRPDLSYRATPFYYAYHQQNNRKLFEKISQIFKPGLIQTPALKPRPKRQRPKIGIISQHFYKQSVMDFYFHTILNLPKEFHLTIINIDPVFIDDVTKKIYKRADKVLQPSVSQSELIPLINSASFDAIIYPEIGMSPCIYFLAMQRLSPIQMVLIGHPETTGMKTIDYYVSWKNFHNRNANSQFTETLIQLKKFPICYDYPQGIDHIKISAKRLKLPENKILFTIPLLLFKIQPVFDQVIVRIIKSSKNHSIVMVCYNMLELKIKERLKKQLTAKELERVVFKLPFKRREYYALMKKSDVILETFPFGGGNTVLHAMAAGTPIVCLRSDQLKGSFGTGFYEWLDETEFIASTIDEYINLAIKTASNPAIKIKFNEIIQSKKSKIFGNMSGVKEFYEWLHSLNLNKK